MLGLSALGEFYNPDTGVKERIGDLGGVSALLELRQGLALDVDAIYKPLHNGLGSGQGLTVLTWDFPVLTRYHVARLGRAPLKIESEGPRSLPPRGISTVTIRRISGRRSASVRRHAQAGHAYPRRYAILVGQRTVAFTLCPPARITIIRG